MRVLMSIGGPSVFETDAPANEIVIGTANGVVWLQRAGRGEPWRETSRALPGMHVSNLAEDPETGRLYVGTHGNGIHASDDGGRTWEELASLRSAPTVDKWFFPAPPNIAHVKHITFDPRSADTIYVSVEVGGAFKSTDAGQTWRQLSGFFEDV